MTLTRDAIWLWAHEAGTHNTYPGLPGPSRITPLEAACYLGIGNLIMVCYGDKPEPPFERYALPMRSLRRLVWSIVGDGSSRRMDLEPVLELAARQENLSGAMMDDFFQIQPSTGLPGRHDAEAVAGFARRLHGAARRLDLWVVLYDHELGLPVRPHLDACDVITFWIWKAQDLAQRDESIRRLEELAPDKRKMLGLYLWDYGGGAPMPLDTFRRQLDFGRGLVEAGRVDGLILLGSPICDLGLDTVEEARAWVRGLPG